MARKTDLYTVDGASLFIPLSPFSVSLESLADPNTGRTDDGIMHITFIRSKLLKFSYKCGSLNNEEMEYLMNLVQGRVYKFAFKHFGKKNVIDAYTGTIQFDTVDIIKGVYTNVQFSIIEI